MRYLRKPDWRLALFPVALLLLLLVPILCIFSLNAIDGKKMFYDLMDYIYPEGT